MIAMEFEYGYAFHCFFRLLSLSSHLISTPPQTRSFCTWFSSVSMERAHCVYVFCRQQLDIFRFCYSNVRFYAAYVCVCVRFFLSQLLVCLHFVSLLPCYSVAGGWWLVAFVCILFFEYVLGLVRVAISVVCFFYFSQHTKRLHTKGKITKQDKIK